MIVGYPRYISRKQIGLPFLGITQKLSRIDVADAPSELSALRRARRRLGESAGAWPAADQRSAYS
jgi:uncharacterized lipoprotein YbaY